MTSQAEVIGHVLLHLQSLSSSELLFQHIRLSKCTSHRDSVKPTLPGDFRRRCILTVDQSINCYTVVGWPIRWQPDLRNYSVLRFL